MNEYACPKCGSPETIIQRGLFIESVFCLSCRKHSIIKEPSGDAHRETAGEASTSAREGDDSSGNAPTIGRSDTTETTHTLYREPHPRSIAILKEARQCRSNSDTTQYDDGGR